MGVMAVALVAGMSEELLPMTRLLNKVKRTRHAAGRLEGTYPPFSFQGEDGKLTGLKSLRRGVGKHLGVKASLKPTKWDGILASLDAKRIDVVINRAHDFRRPQEKYTSTYLYTVSGVQALVKKGNEGTIKNGCRSAGQKVGVGLGTNYEECRQHVQGVDIRTYDDDPTNIRICAGRIDAILVDRLAARIW